jgi:hypothetical protein
VIMLRCSPEIARLLGMTPIPKEIAGRMIELRVTRFVIAQDTLGGWWRWPVVDGAFAQ